MNCPTCETAMTIIGCRVTDMPARWCPNCGTFIPCSDRTNVAAPVLAEDGPVWRAELEETANWLIKLAAALRNVETRRTEVAAMLKVLAAKMEGRSRLIQQAVKHPLAFRKAKEPKPAEAPPRDPATVCPGHETGGTAPPCCERAGEYNGFASGPTIFTCPKGCSCHD